MYELNLDGKTLWYPGNTRYCVTEAVLHGELNASGYMDITVPKTNPMYSKIESGVNTITLFKNQKKIWTGVVQDVTVNFNGNKDLYVVGVLSYLLRTVQPQHNFLAMVGTDTSSITYYATKRKIISYILDRHNEQIENGKRFYLGTIDSSIGNEYFELNMDFMYSLDALKQLTGETGYFRVRDKSDGNYYLDFVTIENYGKKSGQEIRFAKNLLEYKNKVSGVDICTAILPLGERLEKKNEGTSVEGIDEYLRINSVNNGKDYISDDVAVAKYGLIKKFVKFEGVTDANTLLSKARAYLAEYKTGYLDFDLTALDMSQLDNSIDNYDVGDYVHCICESLDTDVWLPVQSKDTDLLNLQNNKINLSKMPRLNTLTKAAVKLNTDPPTDNSILEDANDYSQNAANQAEANANNFTANQITATKGEFNELLAKKATIDQLNALEINVDGKLTALEINVDGKLTAQSAAIDGALTAQSAAIDGALTAQSISVSSAITTQNATVTRTLNAQDAKISDLETRMLTTDELNIHQWDGLRVKSSSYSGFVTLRPSSIPLPSGYDSSRRRFIINTSGLRDSAGKPISGTAYLSGYSYTMLTSNNLA